MFFRAFPARASPASSGRLVDEHYNNDDVTTIVDHASMMVTTSMETELAHLAYTQALVVRQLLTQAEVHGMQLSIDQSELENQKALNDMKIYEEEKTKNPELKPNLMSLSGKQAKPILQQLNELQDENKNYKAQVENLQRQLAMAQEAASRAAGGASAPPAALPSLQPVMVDGSSAPPAFPGPSGPALSPASGGLLAPAGGVAPLAPSAGRPPPMAGSDGRPPASLAPMAVQGQPGAAPPAPVAGAAPGVPGDNAAGVTAAPAVAGGMMAPGGRMAGSAAVGATAAPAADAALVGQVEKLKGQLKAKNAELMTMKKELSGKVGETTQYQNLKKMMTKKTDELKRFKAELKKYDPKFGNESDDDEVVDDDK